MSSVVTPAMPSRNTSLATTRALKAIEARIAHLAAASCPSTSALGSASAYPRRFASARTSAKPRPSSDIFVRMKFVVPFTIPMTRRSRSPVSDSFSGRISGMPPPTAASKYRSRPLASDASNSSRPRVASSSLFAVTTGLSRSNAARTSSPAGSSPPISSHTMSTSGSSTTAIGSFTNADGGRGTSRALAGSRTATLRTSSRHPARRSMSSRWLSSRRTTAAPTVPHPSIPTRRTRSLIVSVRTPFWPFGPIGHQYVARAGREP